jgi:hypothetical protein
MPLVRRLLVEYARAGEIRRRPAEAVLAGHGLAVQRVQGGGVLGQRKGRLTDDRTDRDGTGEIPWRLPAESIAPSTAPAGGMLTESARREARGTVSMACTSSVDRHDRYPLTSRLS